MKKTLLMFCIGGAGFLSQLNSQTTTFNYTGSMQTYTVPSNVTSIAIDAYGAEGFGSGGTGGRVQATIIVTPNEVLDVFVGGAGGATTGGYNGGGVPGSSGGYGGGGGASDLRQGGAALNNRVIVAGGGGGTGSNCGTNTAPGGYGGGLVGQSGCVWSCSSCQYTGSGGTQSAGGIAGPTAHFNCTLNTNGSFGQGGSNTGSSGTGGGGGWYGGGSGCYEGAGGGSSYTIPSATSVVHTQGGRTGNGMITITIVCTLTATNSITNVSCFGGTNGTATVVPSNGSSPYTYAWTSGGTNATESGLIAGSYTCTITDAGGCITTQSATITQPTLLVPTASAMAISCNGGNSTVTVGASGGTAPYSGTGTFTQTAGTYSYTITDNNGCTAIASVTITQPTVIVPTATATSIACNGGNSTVMVAASGGTAPYSGTGTFMQTAGTYSYTVTDNNGCTSTASITITEPGILVATPNATSILCNGGNSTVTVVASGGTAPYTGDGSFTQIAGTYSYTVTDNNGCTAMNSITITEPTAIATAIVTTDVTCNGASDGAIDITVTGGTGPYTFDWNSGTFTTEDLTGIPAGNYVGVLTDANGCTDGGTIVINEPAAVVATWSLAASIICLNDAAITLTGGSPAGGTYSGTGVTANSFNPMTAGNGMQVITYTFTDSTGCSGMAIDSITVDPCTGISTETSNTIFSVYPNPNNGTFTFVQNESASVEVMIYDAIGQLVTSFKANAGIQQQLNLETAGMYTITIVNSDGNRTSQRVIVNR
ncbi:hypothetical protein BH09BAC5_BH09BAC5_02220 [soil metagenome]